MSGISTIRHDTFQYVYTVELYPASYIYNLQFTSSGDWIPEVKHWQHVYISHQFVPVL